MATFLFKYKGESILPCKSTDTPGIVTVMPRDECENEVWMKICGLEKISFAEDGIIEIYKLIEETRKGSNNDK